MTISIILPVYNKERYIYSTLNTIANQSFTDFECILIDDGSTDGSGSICDDFAFKDARFKVFHIPNGGVSHARNVGLDYARGKYITFIDADDSFHVDYLKNLYDCITKSNADLVIGSSLKVWDGSELQVPIQVPFSGLKATAEVMPFFARDQLATGIYGYCWGKLLKRSLINSHRFNEEIRLAEDLDFYLSIYPETKSLYFDNKPYYYYLQAAENSSMLAPDWKIDYFSQIGIQLKTYNMLKNIGFLNSENKYQLTNRIYDYVFFTLYYAPKQEIRAYCKQIRTLQLPVLNSLSDRPIRQKWVLSLYLKKWDSFLTITLSAFRKLRQVHY